MGNPVVHFEIGCRDRAKSSEYFSKLFDWKMTDAGPSTTINPGSGIDGHMTALGHEPFNYVTIYVEVDDVKAYLAKAVALGGKQLVPPITIPTGTFAWFADPDGNTIALWKPKA